MLTLLRPSSFMVKSLLLGTTALLFSFISVYIALYNASSPEQLQRIANQITEGTHRKIVFDTNNISRTIFPRPTIILHNVVISKTDHQHANVHIPTMKLGMAWSSLFGSERIEKWVWVQPKIHLIQNADGSFNLSDLFQQSKQALNINRFIIEQGKLSLDSPDHLIGLHDMNVKIKNLTDDMPIFEAYGRFTFDQDTQTQWQIKGHSLLKDKERLFPEIDLNTQGISHQEPFQLKLKSQASWQADTQLFQLKDSHIQANFNNYQAHLTATAPQIMWQRGILNLPKLNTVITAHHQQAQWDSTLEINKLHWRPTVTTAEKLTFTSSRKDGKTNTYFDFNGALLWQKQQGLELSNLMISGRHENTLGNPLVRLRHELTGSFSRQNNGNWQSKLIGLFDQEPINLDLQYQTANNQQAALLRANINLEKLNLSPYLANNNIQASHYPQWLSKTLIPSIQAQLQLKTMQFPNLEIHHFKSQMNADGNSIHFPDIQAELYGGKTMGSITIHNTQPISYQLKQTAHDVYILPLMQDLFEYRSLTGQGSAWIDIQSQGNTHQDFIKNLNGQLQLNISKGALLGIDLNNALNPLPSGQGERKTPFQHLRLTSKIENGIGYHENTRFSSQNFDIESQGETNFYTQELNENLRILPKTGNGSPIPLKIRGKIDNPSLTVDYSQLTQGLDSPEQRQQALTQALKEQWQWFKPKKAQ